MTYLDHCELTAVAIDTGAMDEKMYMQFNRSAYVQAWDRTKEFIQAARTRKNQPTLFEHFEALAKRWTN